MVDALFEAALGALDGESWLQMNPYYEKACSHKKFS